MKIKWLITVGASLIMSGCAPSLPKYQYVAQSAHETPATIEHIYGTNPYTKQVLFSDITEYSEMLEVIAVGSKSLSRPALPTPDNSQDFARNNRILLSPGQHTVSFEASTRHLRSLPGSFTFQAYPGEAYFLRISPSPQISSGQQFSIAANFAAAPVPTVILINSKGQILQALTYRSEMQTRDMSTCSKTNAKIYGGNPCPVRNIHTRNYIPVPISTTAPIPIVY